MTAQAALLIHRKNVTLPLLKLNVWFLQQMKQQHSLFSACERVVHVLDVQMLRLQDNRLCDVSVFGVPTVYVYFCKTVYLTECFK